jgi:hypothetical protein
MTQAVSYAGQVIYTAQPNETLLCFVHGFIVAHPDRAPEFRAYRRAYSVPRVTYSNIQNPNRW